MQCRTRQCSGRWLALAGILVISLALLALTSCESGGNSDSDGNSDRWANFDFGSNNTNVCLALGDSITAGGVLDDYSQCYIPKLAGMLHKTIVNEAIPGSETGDGMDLIHPGLDATHPGFLILLYGVNDVIMGRDLTVSVENLRFIVQAAKDNKTAPIIGTLTPVAGEHVWFASVVDRMNAAIRQMAAEEGITVADLDQALNWDTSYLLPDGLHPNAAGNDIMATTFYDVMK